MICLKERESRHKFSVSGPRKEICFDNHHDLGVAISVAHKWAGKDIAITFSEALEDANFHTENKKVREIFGVDEEKKRFVREEEFNESKQHGFGKKDEREGRRARYF